MSGVYLDYNASGLVRPEVLESLPEPAAYLSWTVTEARTAPDLRTYPLNFTRLGCVTTPLETLTVKL